MHMNNALCTGRGGDAPTEGVAMALVFGQWTRSIATGMEMSVYTDMTTLWEPLRHEGDHPGVHAAGWMGLGEGVYTRIVPDTSLY